MGLRGEWLPEQPRGLGETGLLPYADWLSPQVGGELKPQGAEDTQLSLPSGKDARVTCPETLTPPFHQHEGALG